MKTVHIPGGASVSMSDPGTEKVVVMVSDGKSSVELPLLSFLQAFESVMTMTDLRGGEADAIDPRYKARTLIRSLFISDGRATGTRRFACPGYMSMYGSDSMTPIPR